MKSVFLAFLFLSGCATGVKSQQAIHFDISKIRSYDLDGQMPFRAPYVAVFQQGEKRLTYIASAHVSQSDFPNPFESPTFKTIRKIFSRERPQAVIVEGTLTTSDLSPSMLRLHAEECRKTNYKGNCDEPSLAINEAIDSGAAYIGGEPNELSIQDEVVKSGFTVEDLMGFYFVRWIPVLKRQNRFSPSTLSSAAETTISEFRRQTKSKVIFTYDDFVKWYADKMQKPEDFKDIEVNDTGPATGHAPTFIQRISYAVGLARDKGIVKTAERMLNQFDRVLIVCGASHLTGQEPAFEHSLGPPKYEALFGPSAGKK